MKEPWATPNGATHKTCYPFQKKRDNSRKKNIKTSKKSKNIFKNQKNKKKNWKNCKKTLKNTRKRKRERSGSEAAGKKTMENREKTLKSSNPLRSRSAPASFRLRSRFKPVES